MNRRRAKFDRKGMLAMKPEAFGLDFLFFEPEQRAPFELVGDTAIVRVEGPLTHHEDWWCYSYDRVREDMAAALASKATNVLMLIDSPGGECSGCFETSRELRAMAKNAGKPLTAYIEGMGASGGYAIACAAERIYASETAMIGSIGVIGALVDVTAQDAMYGEKWTIIASGARKADGNPHVATSDETKSAVSKNINSLAELFFGWVGEARGSMGLSVDAARGLEAGVFVGADAVERRLADEITTRSALLQSLQSATTKTNGRIAAAQQGATAMAWKDEMKKAAADGDEDAKKCLEAMGDDDEKKDEKAEEPEKKEGAEGSEPEKKDDDEKKDEKAEEPEKKEQAASASTVDAIKAKANAVIDAAVEAAVAERMRPIELKAALDERLKEDPHMPQAFRNHCLTLSSAKELKSLLAVTPKFPAVRNSAPTVGKHVDEKAEAGLEGDELEKMNRAMGVGPAAGPKMPGVDADGVFRLHVVKPSDFRNETAKRDAVATKGK